MSMEIHVAFRGKLPTKATLTRAMRALGFPVSIIPPRDSLEDQSGFMPMRLWRDDTGSEFDIFEGRESVEACAGDHAGEIDTSFDRCASFRWGGDDNEMVVALCACAALAQLVNGVVLDDSDGRLLSADEMVAEARNHLATLMPKDEVKQPGTRPSDIKRYLKPLLQLRSDLVLRERTVMIAPVRHLMRGALLDRTSSKYDFNVWHFVKPLYGDLQGIGLGATLLGNNMSVWQPHFQELLMDSLAEDVFAGVGRVTTFEQFAALATDTAGPISDQVIAMILAGGWDYAAEYIESMRLPPESDDDLDAAHEFRLGVLNEERDRFGGDISALCAAYHTREAENVKALKLEQYWARSLFPVELPPEQRASMLVEQPFATTPWIERPNWLIGAIPETPGEVRFAKETLVRPGEGVLLVPLTPEQAAERHRETETYAAALRLPDSLLLVIRRLGEDRNDPERLGLDQPRFLHIQLHGASRVATVTTGFRPENDGLMDLRFISVRDRLDSYPEWQCSVNLERDDKGIHDSRGGPTAYSRTPLTPFERELVTCSIPGLDEYVALGERVKSLLRTLGYGQIR